MTSAYSPRPGSAASQASLPPTRGDAPNSVTSCPRSAAMRAACRPGRAGADHDDAQRARSARRPPARLAVAGRAADCGSPRAACRRGSRPRRNCRSSTGGCRRRGPRAPCAGQSASAISARVRPTRSPAPSAIAASASAGIAMRPIAITGVPAAAGRTFLWMSRKWRAPEMHVRHVVFEAEREVALAVGEIVERPAGRQARP